MEISLSISIKINNLEKKLLIKDEDIDINHLLAILKINEHQRKKLSDKTLQDIFDLYVIEKNLKPNTITTYRCLLISLFGVNCFKEQINNLCAYEKINEISTKTIDSFCYSTVCSIFNFAQKKQLILENPFINKDKFIIKKKIHRHKKALNCENWLCLNEAWSTIDNFISTLLLFNSVRYSKLNQHIILLTIILATRISETFQIIKTFNKTNEKDHYIFIDNKNTKKGADLTYRVPLTDLAVYIIKKIHRLGFNEKSFLYRKNNLYTYLRLFLQQNKNNEKISVHGFRSIFRTVIELLPETQNIPNWIKELSLSHETRGTIERIYQRSDAFKQRYFIQLEYSKFIFKILNNSIYLNVIKNDKFLDNLK